MLVVDKQATANMHTETWGFASLVCLYGRDDGPGGGAEVSER